MRSGALPASVPKLWTMGCFAVPAMAVATFISVSAVIAKPGLFAKGFSQHTYFVTPHLGMVIWQTTVLVAVFGIFAGWYHFFPKITGYAYSERLGRIHFWLSIAGVGDLDLMQIIIWAQLFLFNSEADMLRFWRLISPVSACLLAAGLLVFFTNMVLSFVRRQPASHDGAA